MFDETKKYINQGHFFFNKGDKLKEVSKDVPGEPGVYYILRLAKGKVQLVYIGKSGTIAQNGKFAEQLLKGRINVGAPLAGAQNVSTQKFFDKKMTDENIDSLDIYWFVTLDETNYDLPGYAEGILMQRFFEVHGHLPEWNIEF